MCSWKSPSRSTRSAFVPSSRHRTGGKEEPRHRRRHAAPPAPVRRDDAAHQGRPDRRDRVGAVLLERGRFRVVERKPDMTEMEWQCRNWLYFSWLSGDHIVEQHVHNIDVVNWAMGAMPKNVMGMGGRQVRVRRSSVTRSTISSWSSSIPTACARPAPAARPRAAPNAWNGKIQRPGRICAPRKMPQAELTCQPVHRVNPAPKRTSADLDPRTAARNG